MSKKDITTAIIFLFAIVNVKTQCNKGDMGLPPGIQFEFRQNVSATSYRLDYNVGDTIWLEVSALGKKLFDEKSNTHIVYDSVGFTSIVQVDLLYNNPFVANGPFVSFIFPTGISASTGNSGPQTYTYINYGCAPSADYHLLLGVVLLQKGVFGISMFNSSIQKCLNNYYQPAKLTYYFDVSDTHAQYYQQLSFSSIGKQVDTNIVDRLNKKLMVVINVN
jgi:hypothetical protein